MPATPKGHIELLGLATALRLRRRAELSIEECNLVGQALSTLTSVAGTWQPARRFAHRGVPLRTAPAAGLRDAGTSEPEHRSSGALTFTSAGSRRSTAAQRHSERTSPSVPHPRPARCSAIRRALISTTRACRTPKTLDIAICSSNRRTPQHSRRTNGPPRNRHDVPAAPRRVRADQAAAVPAASSGAASPHCPA